MKTDLDFIKKIIGATDDKRDQIIYKCYQCDSIFPIYQYLSDHIEFIAPFCAISTYPIYNHISNDLLSSLLL